MAYTQTHPRSILTIHITSQIPVHMWIIWDKQKYILTKEIIIIITNIPSKWRRRPIQWTYLASLFGKSAYAFATNIIYIYILSVSLSLCINIKYIICLARDFPLVYLAFSIVNSRHTQFIHETKRRTQKSEKYKNSQKWVFLRSFVFFLLLYRIFTLLFASATTIHWLLMAVAATATRVFWIMDLLSLCYWCCSRATAIAAC